MISSQSFMQHMTPLVLGLLILCLPACTGYLRPEAALPQTEVGRTAVIQSDANTGEQRTEIDVLVYNIAALPWPILLDRVKAQRLIGDQLAEMRKEGRAPHIILIQEGFRGSIQELIDRSGYPNWVRGPVAHDHMPKFSDRAPEDFTSQSYFWKGERFGKWINGGLYILSDFPIHAKWSRPFFRHECAGFDCVSNKGMLFAEIEIPGVPEPILIGTTHLNSRGSTGVPEKRSATAHALQIDHLDSVFDEIWNGKSTTIIGGDFNAKQARERLDYFIETQKNREAPMELVHDICQQSAEACIIHPNHDGDAPWEDTNDWQVIVPGTTLHIKPIAVDAWFDEEVPEAPVIKGRQTLSDHDALWVRYSLRWKLQNETTRKQNKTE